MKKNEKVFEVHVPDQYIQNLNEKYYLDQGLIREDPFIYTFISGKYLDFDESLIK